MQEKILIGDLESSDENEFIDVKYKGTPFSGIAYADTEHYYSEYGYLNGFGQGRCFSVYKNGQLYEDLFLDKGEIIEGTTWYENGITMAYFRIKPELSKFWNAKGVLLEENTDETRKEWYASGKIKILFTKGKEYIYYGESGKWVVKINAADVPPYAKYVVTDKEKMTYNMSYIENNYMSLLQDDDFYPYFIGWLEDKEDNKKKEAVCNMIKSNNLRLKYDGINLAVKYKIYDALPYIKLEINNGETPPIIYNLRGMPSISYGHTISQRAINALEKLELR
jgi:hypothetical protein